MYSYPCVYVTYRLTLGCSRIYIVYLKWCVCALSVTEPSYCVAAMVL